MGGIAYIGQHADIEIDLAHLRVARLQRQALLLQQSRLVGCQRPGPHQGQIQV